MMKSKFLLPFAVFILLSPFLGALAREGGEGGSTGHGPARGDYAGLSRIVRQSRRAKPECLRHLGYGVDLPSDELPRTLPAGGNAVFEDGAAIIDGIYVPSSDGDPFADVACAMIASQGSTVPTIGECVAFATCLGLSNGP